MSQHARCSASAAERWMNCSGSINLGPGERTTPFVAVEGTVAHDIAAQYLKTGVQPFDRGCPFGTVIQRDGHEIEFNEEMWDAIVLYVATCTSLIKNKKNVWIEVDLTPALKTLDPDLGGTGDFAAYDDKAQHLDVVDFKYGKGTYVEADDNKQLMIYALGILMAIGVPAKTVALHIVQPRYEGVEPVRKVEFPAYDLIEFGGEAAVAAQNTRKADAPLTAGPWCRKTFCPHAHHCPKLEELQHAVVAAEATSIEAYNPEQLATALQAIPLVEARIKAVKEIAYRAAVAGHTIPGFKLVPRRATRHWNDPKEVVKWAHAHAIDPYHAPELKTPAQLEKGMKAAEKRQLEPMISKVSTGSSLVPESDSRAPISKQVTVDDFPALGGPEGSAPVSIDNIFE